MEKYRLLKSLVSTPAPAVRCASPRARQPEEAVNCAAAKKKDPEVACNADGSYSPDQSDGKGNQW